MPYFYTCFPDDKTKPGPRPVLITDDQGKRDAWITKHDRPGYAVYWCPNPLKDGLPPAGSSRRIENVAAIERFWADIDQKDLAAAPEDVTRRLTQLPVTPTALYHSGGGHHVYSDLKEPVPADDVEMFGRACTLYKTLAAALSADPAPAHPAALMRWPGSHNSKYGEPRLVKRVGGSGRALDITELEALTERLPVTGIFERKPPRGNGLDPAPQQHTARCGEPVDVNQRLADVTYRGPGNTAVHSTELSVTASLLRRGYSVDAAVLTVIEEMQSRHVDADAPWDWGKEELTVRRQCFDFICKHPELSPLLPDGLRESFEAARAQNRKARIVHARHVGWHVRSWVNADNSTKPEPDEPLSEPYGSPPRYRFRLVDFKDLRPGAEQPYLVDELIPIAGIAVIWGKAKCLKSFFTLDLMFHVAMGWEYRDRYVRQGLIIYCAFEGAHGYAKRIEAIRRHYGLADDAAVPIKLMSGQANLIAEHRLLIQDFEAQLEGIRPAAVVLDTLNKSLFGSESKDVDMAAYIRAAEAIRERFGCVVIIVHHCGYDDSHPRGHTSLPGAVDAQLVAVRDDQDILTVTVEMMRDGPEDTQVVSTVEVVEVGTDQGGKTLTSLVVVPSEATPAGIHKGWPRTLIVFHAALKAAIASSGTPFKPEAGALPVRAVGQALVRNRFYETYAEPEEDPKKRQAKMQKAFVRAMGEAQSRGLLKVRHLATGQTMLWVPLRGEE